MVLEPLSAPSPHSQLIVTESSLWVGVAMVTEISLPSAPVKGHYHTKRSSH